MTMTKGFSGQAGILILGLLIFGISTASRANDQKVGKEAVQRALDGKAYWKNKCDTVAGEKIYRKVENVEGLLLLKVRPKAGEREWKTRDWPGAAFAREATGNEYITTFLGNERSSSPKGEPISPTNRGFISTSRRPGDVSGYRWVEVIDESDGQRYRYTGSHKVLGQMDANAPNVKIDLQRNPNFDLNIYGYVLEKVLTNGPKPRYGVTFEDHVIPEERYLGVASSTIKVIDMNTNDVLGELTRYAWSPGAPSRVNPSPWLTAYRCPDHAVGTGSATRKFVDQILIPVRDK